MTEIPLVAWLTALVAVLAVIGFAGYKIKSRANEHGLNMFLSGQFALLFVLASVIWLSVIWPLFAYEDPDVGSAASKANLMWGAAIYVGASLLVYLINSRRCGLIFGIPFTLLQSLVASLSVLAIVAALLIHDHFFSSNKKRTA